MSTEIKMKPHLFGLTCCHDYISSDYRYYLYFAYKIRASVDFSFGTRLFCSSSLASSSSSSGLRFSESAGDSAGPDSAASWEEESGLSTGLPVDKGSWSMPEGEEGHSSWGRTPAEPSLSGLQLGMDMALGWGGLRWAWTLPDWSAEKPNDQGSSNLPGKQRKKKADEKYPQIQTCRSIC